MSNEELFALITAMSLCPEYSIGDPEDIDYMDNEPVQDLLFDFYLGLLQLGIMDVNAEDYDDSINTFASNIHARLVLLKPDEQAYVRKQMKKTLQPEEEQDDVQKLEKRKEND